MKDTFNCRNTRTGTQVMEEAQNFGYSSRDKYTTDRWKGSKRNVAGKEKCINRGTKVVKYRHAGGR